jgi:GT2 family glycosyltransferase
MIGEAKGRDRIVAHIGITSGPRIASARNKMVEYFLDHPAKPQWLWMLDSDMEFPADTLDRMLKYADQYRFPILGGLCFGGRRNVVFPTLYRMVANGDSPLETINDFPLDTLVKVDATGTACLLIHRRVLEKMKAQFPAPQHWFSESTYKGIEFGEDVTFCLRAAQLDIPIHVHTGITVGHVKPRVIGLADYMLVKELAAQ